MNDLLKVVVETHGGLSRWSQLTTVKASLSIGRDLARQGKPENWHFNVLSFAENYHRSEEETAMKKNTDHKLLSLAEQRTNDLRR
jgi:hypothetical protein